MDKMSQYSQTIYYLHVFFKYLLKRIIKNLHEISCNSYFDSTQTVKYAKNVSAKDSPRCDHKDSTSNNCLSLAKVHYSQLKILKSWNLCTVFWRTQGFPLLRSFDISLSAQKFRNIPNINTQTFFITPKLFVDPFTKEK